MDTRTPAEKEDAALRDRRIMQMRREGCTFQAIGDELGFSRQYAHERYTALLKDIAGHEVAEYRREQEERLDGLLRKAHEVLERQHITVSNGQVVRLDGQPVPDDAPTLAAIKTILDIETRRAKLLGLDAPTKTEVSGSGLLVELVGIADPKKAMT
jgi:hypothetical protein